MFCVAFCALRVACCVLVVVGVGLFVVRLYAVFCLSFVICVLVSCSLVRSLSFVVFRLLIPGCCDI